MDSYREKDFGLLIIKRAPLLLCLLSMGLFLASLFLPALLLETQALSGWHVLAFGWYGLLTANVAWFANLAYVYALSQMLLMRHARAGWVALGGAIVSLQSWTAEAWWFNEGSGTPIEALGSAYYVWTISLIILVSAAFLARRLNPPLARAKAKQRLSERWMDINR